MALLFRNTSICPFLRWSVALSSISLTSSPRHCFHSRHNQVQLLFSSHCIMNLRSLISPRTTCYYHYYCTTLGVYRLLTLFSSNPWARRNLRRHTSFCSPGPRTRPKLSPCFRTSCFRDARETVSRLVSLPSLPVFFDSALSGWKRGVAGMAPGRCRAVRF